MIFNDPFIYRETNARSLIFFLAMKALEYFKNALAVL